MIESLLKLPRNTMDSKQLPQPQQDILYFLYRFRFLTSIQLQHFLHHKDIRLTNYHLKHLIANNYLGKHYSRSLGYANLPAVYYLASGSINELSKRTDTDKRAIKRIYREKNRSQQFVTHSLLLADYYLMLEKDSLERGLTLYFFTKTDLLSHPYIIHPLPDAYFARKDKKGYTKRYFLEVVEDSSPRFALRKRVEQYCDYIDSEKFTDLTGYDFPNILFICPGYASLIYLKKHIGKIYEETSLDQAGIYIATKEQAFAGRWEQVTGEEED